MSLGIVQKLTTILLLAGAVFALAGCGEDKDDAVIICNPGCVDRDTIRECIQGRIVDTLCPNGCNVEQNVCF